MFRDSRASVCLIIRNLTRPFATNLLPDVIKVPEGPRLEEVINGFEQRWGFPQCTGAIDVTHISVTPPTLNKDSYRNRKGLCSINAQCIVDHQCMFTDVFVGWPGRSHDARVFKNSDVCIRAEAGNPLFPRRPRVIENTDIPQVLLGDPAYPLKNWLMKPPWTLQTTKGNSSTVLAGQEWSFKKPLVTWKGVGVCSSNEWSADLAAHQQLWLLAVYCTIFMKCDEIIFLTAGLMKYEHKRDNDHQEESAVTNIMYIDPSTLETHSAHTNNNNNNNNEGQNQQ